MGEKRVRILLRVSSDKQLEADGDLSIQRQLVTEYIKRHSEWTYDNKEYFEGSSSGYKNKVSERNILKEIYNDAKRHEFDILVVYKDDRIGRRMWETGDYIMSLKTLGVDVYTVKDGLITPETDDIMGQMMLALRYGNAQKSSSDTGMRVKDTAQKLVENGKFMGGRAPYGYRLEYSGEISKHGRALKQLVIVPEHAQAVKYIYELSLNREYGSLKIANILNSDERYKSIAPNDMWKAGTVTGILTNPVYAGYTVYKKREHINGKYHRHDFSEWIISKNPNKDIVIIDEDIWHKVQDKRKLRSAVYTKSSENSDRNVIKNNSGMLALIDVLYCGYCSCKMTNGSKYNYWTIKHTGEKKSRRIPAYRCGAARQGIPHDKVKIFRADVIEPVVFEIIAQYIDKLLQKEDIASEIEKIYQKKEMSLRNELIRETDKLEKIRRQILVMESRIADAVTGEYPLSLDELILAISKHKAKEEQQIKIVEKKKAVLQSTDTYLNDKTEIKERFLSWNDVFIAADTEVKRIIINRLVEKITVKEGELEIRLAGNE